MHLIQRSSTRCTGYAVPLGQAGDTTTRLRRSKTTALLFRRRCPLSGGSVSLYISKLEIENFRNFSRLVIDPFPARAVIVGENNAGKSNLLYALRILLDPDLPDSARRLRPEDLWEGIPGGLSSEATIRIAIELRGFDGDEKAEAALYDYLTSLNPKIARLEYKFAPDRTLVTGGAASTEDASAESIMGNVADLYDWTFSGGPDGAVPVADRELRRAINVRILPALRNAQDELSKRRSPLRDLLSRVTVDPRTLQTAAAQATDATKTLLGEKELSDLQDRIRSQVADLAGPSLPMTPTLGMVPTKADQLIWAIRLYVDAEGARGMTDTSLGTANVAYLALLLEELAARRASVRTVSTTLGVEEPEAHLHVQIQRRLFGHLLQNEPALLLTTHSPHIAAVAGLNSLILLRSGSQGSTAHTANSAGLDSNQVKDLERYLDASRAELLFARAIIFVEGDAERYIIPALAHAVGFDLDEHGVSVVSVQGADFVPFSRLTALNALSIPSVIITDGDRRTDIENELLPGLVRAEKLMRVGVPAAVGVKEQLGDDTVDVVTDDDVSASSAATPIDLMARRAMAAEANIFVGDATLEIDIARLLHAPVEAATKELPLGTRATALQLEDLTLIRDMVDSVDVRRAYISRVERVGKGRAAQRLADHLRETDVARLVVQRIVDVGGSSDDQINSVLLTVHGGYLIAALERVSHLVRERGLFSDPPPDGESTDDDEEEEV